MAAVAGRGRGVMRSYSSSEVNASENGESSESTHFRLLRTVEQGDTDENLRRIVEMVKDKDSVEFEKELIASMKYTVMKEPDLAGSLAKLCHNIIEAAPGGSRFRTALLRTVQSVYKERSALRNENVNGFIGLCSFLSELYNLLIISGKRIKPLCHACYAMLRDLVREDATLSEMLCIQYCYQLVGRHLEGDDQERMNELLDSMRITVISDKTSAANRCILVEMIELHASGWDIPFDVRRLYLDQVAIHMDYCNLQR